MIEYFLKGIFIGIIFGIPIGAVGALTIQRTLIGGKKAGFITGLGSSVADCIYAACGAFGITLISDFLSEHGDIVRLLGRILLIIIGVSIFRKKISYEIDVENVNHTRIVDFLSSFFIGITNPVAIATFLIVFAYLGIADNLALGTGCALIVGVFIGTYFWWIVLSIAVDYMRNRLQEKYFSYVTKGLGVLLIALAFFIR